MSVRFFGFFALLWGALSAFAIFSEKGTPEAKHYCVLMATVLLSAWSIMRKIDGKEPL